MKKRKEKKLMKKESKCKSFQLGTSILSISPTMPGYFFFRGLKIHGNVDSLNKGTSVIR